MLVEARELTRYYGSFLAVDGISFAMDRGEIVGLLGPNGAGKTTTMRMLTGFLPPSGGTAVIAGHDVMEEPSEVRRHIGYMPESNPLYTEMRTSEYLAFRADLKGVPRRERKRRIAECVDLCGVAEVAGQIILSLPLGNDASAVLARANAAQVNWMTSLVGLYLPASMQQSSGSEIAAAVASATEQIRSTLSEAAIISPPLPVINSDEGIVLSPQFAEALDAGMGATVGSVGLHISDLPHSAVLTEEIDGDLRRQPGSFWAGFDGRYDFASLRQTLTQRQLRLPLFLDCLPVAGTGEARLDALMLGRLLISGFAQGCTAATFPVDLLSSLQEEEADSSPLFAMIRELTRELAGTVPLRGLAGKEGFSGRMGEPIVYRSFMRKNEGVLFMWNNTSRPIDVAVVLQALPLQMHLLRLSYSEQFVQRRFQGLFSLTDEARTNRQQAVYVRVRPLEIVGLSFNFKNPHAGWLGQLAPRPPVKKDYGPDWPTRGDEPWGLSKREQLGGQ